uniref:phosphatidylinositol 3-kinase regulatory subunit alpha-like isoform X2 n=1 Tax=Solea senegalensis TaxID=28829 RepID=UPI001CD91661|nr:phosphatidylinositol 3-kinase regulatory subunit alpha-like isoform X2 [Solea senegalensis]
MVIVLWAPVAMAAESFQYRTIYEYRRERVDDISLQLGDVLTVPRYQEGEERSPKGWLRGTNERTKEQGTFPGTFVEYIGESPASKPWPRPAAWTNVGPQPQGAAAASDRGTLQLLQGAEAELLSDTAPVVVRRLTEAIEKHGLNSESLYGAPAASGGPAELRQSLDSDPVSVDLDQYDVDLDTPIIPATVCSELVYTAEESQSVEECGDRLRRILESPSIHQANHQLLVHLSRHLARVSLHNQARPRLLGQSFTESIFKHSLLSVDVNPEHHVRVLEALVATGGLTEMQSAPGDIGKGHCSELTRA